MARYEYQPYGEEPYEYFNDNNRSSLSSKNRRKKKSRQKDFPFPIAIKQKRQPLLPHNTAGTAGLSGYLLQFSHPRSAHAEHVMGVFSGQLPQKNLLAHTDIQKTLLSPSAQHNFAVSAEKMQYGKNHRCFLPAH